MPFIHSQLMAQPTFIIYKNSGNSPYNCNYHLLDSSLSDSLELVYLILKALHPFLEYLFHSFKNIYNLLRVIAFAFAFQCPMPST